MFLRPEVPGRTKETMMFEEAACCALSEHRHSKMQCAISLPRIYLYQSTAKRIVGEFDAIANTKLMKNFVKLDFHSSLSD